MNKDKDLNLNKDYTGFDYFAHNEIEDTFDYLGANFNNIANSNFRRAMDLTNATVGKIVPKKWQEELEEKIEEIKISEIETNEAMERFKKSKGIAGNVALDVSGGLVRSFGDPVNFLVNRLLPGGVIVDILQNITEYAYDTSSLYGRSILKDFNTDDAVNIGTSAVMSTVFGKMNNKYKPLVDVPLYDEGFNLKPSSNKKKNNEIQDIFREYGIFEKSPKEIYDKLIETQQVIEMIKNEKNPKMISKYEEILQKNVRYVALLDNEPIFNNLNRIMQDGNLSASEMMNSFKEIKNNYNDFNSGNREYIANEILEVAGFEPENVDKIRVRASIPKNKVPIKTGIDADGNPIFVRNKWLYGDTDARIMFEKGGDTYLVKAVESEGKWLTDVKRLGDIAPIDKLLIDNEKIVADVNAMKEIKRMGYGSVLNLKNYAEYLERQRYGRPQDNYIPNSIDDYNNFINIVSEIDVKYKNENYEIDYTGEIDKTQKAKKTSSIKMDEELTMAIRPLIKNIEMNMEQILAEDAQELFGTKIIEPFGNPLWKKFGNMDKRQFADFLQGKAELEGVDPRVQKVLKRKLNELIQIKSGKNKTLNIEEAYFSDVVYNKQDLMIYLNNLFSTEKVDGIEKLEKIDELGRYIGEEVYLTREEAKAANLNWDNNQSPIVKNKLVFNGAEGEYETKMYSINKNPLEVVKAFYHAINSTTGDLKKKGKGTFDYQDKYQVAERWGNKREGMTRFDNYMSVFEGFENNPYEIISRMYGEVAKHKLELDKFENMINDITVNEGEFTNVTYLKERKKIQGFDEDVRNYLKKQLKAVQEKYNVESRYKINFWADPNDPKLNLGMLGQVTKDFFNWKLLFNFKSIFVEFGTDEWRTAVGARSLGWNKNYSAIKSFVIEPIKVYSSLIKNYNNIKNGTIDKIKDPVIRRRAEIFIQKRIANDPIYNDLSSYGIGKKVAQAGYKGLRELGKEGAIFQTVSDVHRIPMAEYNAINYMKDIFPNLKKHTVKLEKILTNNGLKGENLEAVRNRLSEISDTELMELCWSGKRANNGIDYKIQSLFEQFSDVMSKEYNAFKKVEGIEVKGRNLDFVYDQVFLYKRYSLSMLENFIKGITTYYADDGMIRKRFDYNGDFKKNYKQTFKGFNARNLFDFGKVGVGTGLSLIAVKYAHGKLSGSTEDEIAMTRLEALSNGNVIPFLMDSMSDAIADQTGAGIVLGGKSVLGGVIGTTESRRRRAFRDGTLTTSEKIFWFSSAFLSPEFIARGIDTMKLGKSIPPRLTTSSEEEDFLWKTKYKVLARLDQIEGKLPIEKAIGTGIEWLSFFKKHPEKAYEITGVNKGEIEEDKVIAGAAGFTELAEEQAEMSSIVEILNDKSEFKEQQLKMLGLDVDTQLNKMDRAYMNTFNSILAFKKIRDEEEILFALYQFNKAEDKKEFLKSFLEDFEKEYYYRYMEDFKKNGKDIKRLFKEKEAGTDGYINYLNVIDKKIRGEI